MFFLGFFSIFQRCLSLSTALSTPLSSSSGASAPGGDSGSADAFSASSVPSCSLPSSSACDPSHPPNFAAIFSCWGGSFFHSLLSCSSLRLHFFAFRFRRFSSDAFSEGTVSCSALLSGEEACVFSFSSGLLRLLFCLIERCRILIRLSYCFRPVGFYSGGRFRSSCGSACSCSSVSRCPLRHIFCPGILVLRPGCFGGVYAEFLQDAFTVGKSSVFRADLIEQFFSRCLICPLTLQQRLLFSGDPICGVVFSLIFYPSCTCAIPCASIVWIWSSHKA